jgi:hypothetical protein
VWSIIMTDEWGHEVTEILAPSQSPGADEPERTASTAQTPRRLWSNKTGRLEIWIAAVGSERG